MKAPITESQWLAAGSWFPVCEVVRRRENARRMRLFGCACCRRLESLLADERSRTAIEVAEQFADGAVKRAALDAARAVANAAVKDLGQTEYKWEPDGWAANAAEMVAHGTAKIYFQLAASRAAEAIGQAGVRTNAAERAIQFGLLRDIFGNPFRVVTFESLWRTDTAVTLAKQMYESREFGAMSILADALQDAGCDDEDVLAHCRNEGLHVRGCWVIDLVLGKA
jgi:hypothetical protein